MYCSSCASPLQTGQTSCPACGVPVSRAPQASALRPGAVTTAGKFLFLALALSLVNTVYIWWLVGVSRMIGNFSALITLVLLACRVGLILLMWSRKNWARLLIVAGVGWTAINFVMLVPRLASFGSASPSIVTFGTFAALLALRLYAVYLLFRPESNAWFSRQFVSVPA